MESVNLSIARKLNTYAWIFTAVVLLLVGAMRRIKIPLPEGWDFSFLPPFHAGVNALTAVVLLLALYFIKLEFVITFHTYWHSLQSLYLLFLIVP